MVPKQARQVLECAAAIVATEVGIMTSREGVLSQIFDPLEPLGTIRARPGLESIARLLSFRHPGDYSLHQDMKMQ